MLNIGPGGNDGGKNHQTEGEQRHRRNGATEPEHLTIRDDDDGQVLEDSVDGDRKVLESLSRRVDHTDENERDREPCDTFV